MSAASPGSVKRFYLRLGLTVCRGATSFKDLRRVVGILHPTFRDACVADGMLEGDGEWTQCLEEASIMKTGRTLQSRFTTILQHDTPSSPEALWERFKGHICDDLQHYLKVCNIRQNPTLDRHMTTGSS